MKWVFSVLVVALTVSMVYVPTADFLDPTENNVLNQEPFFGVSFGGNTTSQAKLLIDKVKGYTNFFLINNWDISVNETALNEISQYAVDANLNIMVYYNFVPHEFYTWLQPWLDSAKERWGDQFLGVYLYDEPGGKQIDSGQWRSGPTAKKLFENVSDYADASNRFTSAIPSTDMQVVKNSGLSVFTSDYALYWFDYLAGYDAIFVELGWNNSRTKQTALCRGAANVQDKDWGAIITWTYNVTPYLGSGNEIFQDMVTAYRAGAKYVVVFDYPQINQYGILEEEHFVAMEAFWNLIHCETHPLRSVDGQVAFVLPKDYGWGLRHPNDKIWGFWAPDNSSTLIWDNMSKLVKKYGLRLDIIYDDAQFSFEEKYSKIYFWNGTYP